MSDRPVFTLKEAAEACLVSVKTIRRRLDSDKFPNAHRLDDSTNSPWTIPLADLIASGLTPGKPTAPDDIEQQPAIAQTDTELEKLRQENAELQQRALIAEAELRRADQTIETQSLALKMIEAAPAPADQIERLAADLDQVRTEAAEAKANARWRYRRRLRNNPAAG